MKITKSQLREIIREEIKNLKESYGALDGDQSDALEWLIFFYSDRKDAEILKIAKKEPFLKGVKDSDITKAIKDIRKIYRR